jgi:hypothetical protein
MVAHPQEAVNSETGKDTSPNPDELPVDIAVAVKRFNHEQEA